MRKLVLLFIALLTAVSLRADDTQGWTMYLSYHNNTTNVPAGDLIYSLCEGNLLSYNTKDTEVHLFSKLDGLNGKEIVKMGYSKACATLVLVYSDGGIDLLEDDGDIVNIPQLKNAADGGLTLNDLVINGQWATLSTGTSIVLIDVKKQEIKGVYDFNHNYRTATVFDGNIFCAYGSEIRRCPLSGNPSDESQWQYVYPAYALQLIPFAGELYYLSQGGVFVLPVADSDGNYGLKQLNYTYYTTAYTDGTRLVLSNTDGAAIVDAATPTVVNSYAKANSWSALTRSSDGTLWASEGETGLQAYKLTASGLQADGYPVGGYGPKRDLCNYMRFEGERLLIAGGIMDPYDTQHYPGTLMAYENGKWTTFQEDGIEEQTGAIYRDMLSIVQDPKDATHHFAASNTGLYEFRNYKFHKYYSFENSPLQSASAGNKNYIRIDGLNYDAEGNLLILNSSADTVVKVLRSNGTWTSIYVEPLKQAPTLERMLIDTDGRLWITEKRAVSNIQAGVCAVDYGADMGNASSAVTRFRSDAVNEDGTAVDIGNSSRVYALAQDQNNRIWIGAAQGVLVVDNPEEWFSADFYITQPKVPRNDGTNYADYLLADVPVTAIAVDGANQKWIGTYGSGVYLVNEDGTSILKHFTADNSPLLSDVIQSIAINMASGEVMIGTENGLCSYMGDASEALDDLDKDNIKVYPNPVRPENVDKVTITGLTRDADVKIVTVGGQCVAGGTSTGGTFVWDCKSTSGKRVASGVYYIMITTSDAKKGIVAKVAVI